MPTKPARTPGLKKRTQILRLSVEDQRAFAEAILNPPPLTRAMKRAIGRYHKIVVVER